jgi:hypothetical protein
LIGSFVGGGSWQPYPGPTGNAGARPMPLAGRVSQQLIRSASIYVPEHKLVAAGKTRACCGDV